MEIFDSLLLLLAIAGLLTSVFSFGVVLMVTKSQFQHKMKLKPTKQPVTRIAYAISAARTFWRLDLVLCHLREICANPASATW